MGFYIVLRDGDDVPVRRMTDPFGLTFDASGDFDELLDAKMSPRLARLDPHATTTVHSSEAADLVGEVDALLASVPEDAKSKGRNGQAWRGLNRFRVMLDLCRADSTSALVIVGD